MNILLYCDEFLTRSMTFIYNPLQEIRKHHKLSVCCMSRQNPDLFPEDDLTLLPAKKGFKRFIDRAIRKLEIKFQIQDNTFDRALSSLITERKCDLIHAHWGAYALRMYPVAKRLGIPLLVTFHGFDASVLLKKKSYVRALRHMMSDPAVFGVTVSNRMLDVLSEHAVDTTRMIPLYLGIDTGFFDPFSVETEKPIGKFIFLQVSNFVEVKGHNYTVKAFAEFLKKCPVISNRRPCLVFAGHGPTMPETQRLVQKLGIPDSVEFIGPVDKHQVRALMSTADVFVHNSVTLKNGIREGLPTVLMEAMAMGLPVITTRHSAIPELVRDLTDGILVDERDITAYEAAMRLCYEEKLDWHNPQASRQRIIEGFGLNVHIEKLLSLYEELGSVAKSCL